jgi:hydrogenase maturation protease
MRVLVAGIGNIFLGDDGFGPAVARRLAQRPLPEGVQVVDFGIRGMDLVYALLDEYDAVILVDLAPRGETPGTLSLIEPRLDQMGGVDLDAHGMDPVKVLTLARAMGAPPNRTFLVACEPGRVIDLDSGEEMVMALSEPVQAAVAGAGAMVESLVEEIRALGATKEGERDELAAGGRLCVTAGSSGSDGPGAS